MIQVIIKPRRAGKTHDLAMWVRKNNGIMLCPFSMEVLRIRKEHNIRAYTLVDLVHVLAGVKYVAIDNLLSFNNPAQLLHELSCYPDRIIACSIDDQGFEIVKNLKG